MSTPPNPELIEHRLSMLETAWTEIRGTLRSIDKSLLTLAQLEERHTETRRIAMSAETKVMEIAEGLPIMRLTSTWVIGGVIGIFATLGTVAAGIAVYAMRPQ